MRATCRVQLQVAQLATALETRGRFLHCFLKHTPAHQSSKPLAPQNPTTTHPFLHPRACLKLIPHQTFTFAKVWLLAAKLEIRARRLDAARKILGTAIGMAPKDKLFRSYIGGGWGVLFFGGGVGVGGC